MGTRPSTHRTMTGTPGINKNRKKKNRNNYFVVVSSEKNLSSMPYKCTHVEAKGQSCVSSFMVFTLFRGLGLSMNLKLSGCPGMSD